MEKKIRIGIRGLGLLGFRIARAAQLSSDMEVAVGVAVPDKALDELLIRVEFHPQTRQALPRKIYLAVPRHIGRESDFVKQYNAKQRIIHFEGVSQLCLRNECDCIVDTAYPAGKQDAVVQQYATFPGNIIVQDGAFPEGVLIAPPVIPADGMRREPGNLYRMADCILSGVVPLINALHETASKISLSLLTQYNGREPDYLIAERAGAVYVRQDIRERVEQDISTLFPEVEVDVQSVIQIPSLLHYQGTLTMHFASGMSRQDVLDVLAHTPRICLLPTGVSSTYPINLARSMCDSLPSILVFSDSVSVRNTADQCIVRIIFAIYYRTAAVYSNLDAIRMLCNTDGCKTPIDIMRRTDKEAGF